jgi:hypothetical protein
VRRSDFGLAVLFSSMWFVNILLFLSYTVVECELWFYWVDFWFSYQISVLFCRAHFKISATHERCQICWLVGDCTFRWSLNTRNNGIREDRPTANCTSTTNQREPRPRRECQLGNRIKRPRKLPWGGVRRARLILILRIDHSLMFEIIVCGNRVRKAHKMDFFWDKDRFLSKPSFKSWTWYLRIMTLKPSEATKGSEFWLGFPIYLAGWQGEPRFWNIQFRATGAFKKPVSKQLS